MNPLYKTVGIVGTGAMGRGIAQIAAQAGSVVKLFDVQPGASQKAKTELAAQWDKLVAKNRLDSPTAEAHKTRVLPAATLAELADCDLVIDEDGAIDAPPDDTQSVALYAIRDECAGDVIALVIVRFARSQN